MKVLWITNIEFPEVTSILFGEDKLKTSGGWMLGSAEALLNSCADIELYVATVSKYVKELRRIDGKAMKYFLIPYGKGNLKYNSQYEHYWSEVRELINPDVVHIHGTEYSHGLAYIKACGNRNVVISIQGLTSAYYYYYYYGIPAFDILRHITFRDIIRGNLFQEKKRFAKRGKYEKLMISRVDHIIGRTSWDYAQVRTINPDVNYHFCNEILRPDFYDGEMWNYNNCEPHSIFFSQAHYPIKGFHQLLKAMPYILRRYPDTKIFVGGRDITRSKEGLKGMIKLNGYGAILSSMIRRYGLEEKIHFLGNLDASQMINQYLKCNVFVCSSTIENSPNSLAEAQILGTPVVASYVGGIPDMMSGDEKHLYRFEEVSMLSEKICGVFADGPNQIDMIEVARTRHNKEINTKMLLDIYDEIIRLSADKFISH